MCFSLARSYSSSVHRPRSSVACFWEIGRNMDRQLITREIFIFRWREPVFGLTASVFLGQDFSRKGASQVRIVWGDFRLL